MAKYCLDLNNVMHIVYIECNAICGARLSLLYKKAARVGAVTCLECIAAANTKPYLLDSAI